MKNILRIFLLLLGLVISIEAGPPFLVRSKALILRGGDHPNTSLHEILKEEVLFSRWRTIINRTVRFPNGREVDFDVCSKGCSTPRDRK